MGNLLGFSLPDVSGGTLNPSQQFPDAKAFVIFFTCNHCPYAVAWEDRIIAIDKEYKKRGIPVIAISSNDAVKYPQDGFERMQERSEIKEFPFPYLYDETQEIAKNFGAERTPHVFVVTVEGKIIFEGAIDDNYKDSSAVQKQFLRDSLDSFLLGNNPPVSKVDAVGCTIKWKS